MHIFPASPRALANLAGMGKDRRHFARPTMDGAGDNRK